MCILCTNVLNAVSDSSKWNSGLRLEINVMVHNKANWEKILKSNVKLNYYVLIGTLRNNQMSFI